jgi:hypothetical protein
MTIRSFLMPFGIFIGHLVQFVVKWYIFHVLVCLNQDQSGNPAFDKKRSTLSSIFRTAADGRTRIYRRDCSSSRKTVKIKALYFDPRGEVVPQG